MLFDDLSPAGKRIFVWSAVVMSILLISLMCAAIFFPLTGGAT